VLPEIAEQLLEANPRLAKALSLAGISKRGLAAYIILLTRGPMTAAQAARYMDIPITKAYAVFSRLMDVGLIAKQGGRPAVYAARPPREAWLRLKSRLLGEINYVEEKLIPALEAMAGRAATYSIFVLGHGSIEDTASKIMARGKSPLRIALAFPEMLSERLLESLLEASHRRETRILLSSEIKQDMLRELGGVAEIRWTGSMFGGGFIGDEVLLIIRGGVGLVGLWSNHEYFVRIATIYFDHLWETAAAQP